MDDSFFMPMLKTCLNTLAENSRQAGLPKSEIRTIHDALYQHSLDEYVKGEGQNPLALFWPLLAPRWSVTDLDGF